MKMNKNDRQEAILNLIRENEISTQDDLVNELRKQGWPVTQATISRDIKDLGIIKVIATNGSSRYSVLDYTGDVAPGRLLTVFSHSVVSCNLAGNLVVLKTLPGMAQGAASALDSLKLSGVVGTIAGDDTVFIATVNPESAVSLSQSVAEMTARST